MTVQISLLGPLVVEHDGTELDHGGGKQVTVLTALTLGRGRVVATDRLVDLVWGDNPPSKPHVTLRSYISHLRRIIEPEKGPGDRSRLLVTRSPGYALEVGPDAVDIFRFEAAVDGAGTHLRNGRPEVAVAMLDEGLGLWRSVTLENSPLAAFGSEVERLTERRWQAIEMRFDALLALGRHREIVPDLRAVIDDWPTREQPRRQLMLALYRSGRPAEAIEAFRDGQRAVAEATGLDISPALTELEAAILNNDPALDWRSVDETVTGAEPGEPEGTVEPPPGRGDVWAEVMRALSPPAGELIAISGEPGLGKTRLLDTATEWARRSGMIVGWGRGHAGADSVALAPWRALLLDLVEQVDDETLGRLVGKRAAGLSVLVPEVGERLGADPAEPRDPSDLNDTVARFVRRLGADRPLLLCLDDLHWADAASVRLLGSVTPTLRSHPITVLATWRNTHPAGDELAAGLAELARLAPAGRVELAGLSLEAVGQICDRATEQSGVDRLSREAVEEIHRRTGGNPLFTNELLRASTSGSPTGSAATAIPLTTATVNEVISARIDALPDPCRDLLTIGALNPSGFDEQLLAELSDLDDEELLTAVEALLASRLIVEDPVRATRFQFTHSLIGESLAAQLSGPRKARLHNRIAQALEKQQADIGQLAHHFLQGATAGDPTLAATAAQAAARRAAALHDHSGAIDLIERGLAALDHHEDDQVRAELMADLAQERKYLEHYTQSHAAAEEAFGLAKRAGDLDLMVRAALTYAGQGGYEESQFGLHWLGYWNPPGPALEMLRICLDKLPPGPTRTIVLLAYGSQLFGDFDDPRESMIVLDDAIHEARDHNNRRLLCAAIYQKVSTLQREMDFEQRREAIEEGLELALQIRSPHRELALRRARLCLRLDADDIDGATEEIAAGALITKRGEDHNLDMFVASMPIAIDIYQGRLARAEAALSDAFVTYERMGSATLDLFGIQLAVLQREQGRLEEVAAMMGWRLSGYPGPAYGVALAMVLADLERLDECRSVLEQFSDSGALTGGEGVLQFMTPAFYGETLIKLGDRVEAERVYRALEGAAGRTVSMFTGTAFFGSGSLYLGRLATMLGRHDEAARHLTTAERHHRLVDAGPYRLRSLVARADLDALTGRTAEAERARSEADRLAAELDMAWLPAVYRQIDD